MKSAFKISFDLHIDFSDKTLSLEGMAELHNSMPHYKISKITRAGGKGKQDLLPDVDIKCILADGGYKWVHTDSGQETYLSTAIGRSIEKAQGKPAVATESVDDDEEQF